MIRPEFKLRQFALQCRRNLLDFLHRCFGVNKPQSAYWEGDVALLHGQLMIESPKEAIQSKFGWGVRRHKRTGHFTCKPVSIGNFHFFTSVYTIKEVSYFIIQPDKEWNTGQFWPARSFYVLSPSSSSRGNSLTSHMLLVMLWKNSQYAKRQQQTCHTERRDTQLHFVTNKQDKTDW